MIRIIALLALLVSIYGCVDNKRVDLKQGAWLAQLEVMDNKILPFNFQVNKQGNKYSIEVFNADEVVNIDEIEINNDSILIRMPVFEGYISGTFTQNEMNGSFIKESLDRVVPFHASFGKESRFSVSKNPETNISGTWKTAFSPNTDDSYMAKGIFTQQNNKVTGTFRTTTGDYRYLEGVIDGDSLKLSTFDGAHAFLFTAKVTDSTLNGVFYSGNHFKEPFEAERDESFELPSEDSLTFLKEGYERFDFSFPNAEGNTVSLVDNRYKNKVVIVQVMGTWCPNCLDETKFLVDYLDKNQDENLEVVALAFEYAKTKEGAFKSIDRLKERIGVKYPILLAQYGTSDKAQANKKLPMLNHVLSYPTTIFIDKKGAVRKIHTGFNGPATGEKYDTFKKDFSDFVTLLLSE